MNANEGHSSLLEILEENFHRFMIALPRVIQDPDDDRKSLQLRLVLGYMDFLQGRMDVIMNVALARFSVALLQILEFDFSESGERGGMTVSMIGMSESDDYIDFPKRRFRFFRKQNVEDLINEVARKLIGVCDPNLILDHFIEECLNGSYRLQSVYLLNQFLLGMEGKEKEEKYECVEIVLDTVTSEEVWDGKEMKYKEEALLFSLLLEGIGYMAEILKDGFDEVLLIKSLYSILERCGDERRIVHQSAFVALKRIAKFTGRKSIDVLIRDNVDYLIDGISSHLRHFNRNEPLFVLKGILRYCGSTIVLFLEDVLEDILEILDERIEEIVPLLLTVLHDVIFVLKRSVRKNYFKFSLTIS